MNNRVRRYVHGGLSSIPRRTWLEVAALLIALVAAWPLVHGGGLLNTRGGGDSPFLLQRLQQLTSALADGHFPVRWMPDANYGYGYPFFNYYAPLSIYIAAIFRFAGFSYVHSIQLAQVAGFLLAAWATFRLARRWFGDEWAALLAAAAYTLAPFHMVNVYVRGDSLAEFWAMALYPVVLLAADHSVTPGENGRKGLFLLALSYAALILSHNISALIFSPFLLLYLLLRLGERRRQFRRLAGVALGAVVLGLALAAWFWVPALAEKSLVQTEPITQGYFHYSGHFWGHDLVQLSWLFDYSVAGRNAFRVGLVQALLAAGGVLALLWCSRQAGRRLRVSVLFMLITLAVATLMITPLSRPLWDTFPLLPFTQFPWRFLSVQALAGALATGALALLPHGPLKAGATATLILFLLVVALGDLSTDYLALTDDDVSASRLAEYEWFTGNIGSTVSAEYLPETVHPRPYTSPWLENGARNQTQVVAGQASTTLLVREATEQRWEVTTGTEGATVIFPTLYWPGWQATIDGRLLAGGPANGSGLFRVEVPAGKHTLALALGRTPVRMVAELVSLLALLLLLAMAVPEMRRAVGRRQAWLALLALGFLLLLALRLWPEQTLSPSTLTWDFAQMGYLHHAPEGIAFSNGARLLGYDYNRDSVVAGEELVITLQWQGQETPATLVLATPAVHRYETAPVLPAESKPAGGTAGRYTFSLPPDTPAGLYVPRLSVSSADPLLASGDSRGDLFLRPLQITAAAGQEEAAASLQVKAREVRMLGETPAIGQIGGAIGCELPQAGRLLVGLAWYTPRPLAPNYVASLRLLDNEGHLLAQCDVQPGYGFQPSSGWLAGQWVQDRLALSLPSQLPATSPYPLVAHLYLPGGDSVLTRRLGELVWEGETLHFLPTRPTFAVPEGITRASARFGDAAALRGYELEVEDDTLSLTLYWEALAAGEEAYVRFVHLLDPASGQIVERADGSSTVQRDGTPQQESYPTSQWTPGEIIADSLSFSLEGVPAGSYQLAVGFYPPEDPANRLAVSAEEATSLTTGSFLLPDAVPVRSADDE